MNRFYKNLGIVSIIIVIGFSITACGDSPKGLAKQMFQVAVIDVKKFKLSDKEAYKKWKSELDAVEAKVAKLSAEDKKIVAIEYERLFKDYLNSNKK